MSPLGMPICTDGRTGQKHNASAAAAHRMGGGGIKIIKPRKMNPRMNLDVAMSTMILTSIRLEERCCHCLLRKADMTNCITLLTPTMQLSKYITDTKHWTSFIPVDGHYYTEGMPHPHGLHAHLATYL